MELSPEKIRSILVYLFVLVVSVALHEFGHAFVADRLGDDTPRRQGRVTLNPLAHADPIGTLLLPLMSSVFSAIGGFGGGFGWGRPVLWNPHRVSRRFSMATAKVLVSIAGPSMNVVLAVLIAGAHAILAHVGTIPADSEVNLYLLFAVQLNFVLFFFNLLPLPPLDGGHIAQSFMPYRHRDAFDNFARYAPFILLAIMMVPSVQVVFSWPARFCTLHLYQLLGVL